MMEPFLKNGIISKPVAESRYPKWYMSDKYMNILAFFLSYPSLPIDASGEASEEAIKRGDEFRTYIWGEKGIDVLLKSLSYVDYGKDLKRILFQFYIMPCDYERIHIKEIEQYRKKKKAIGIPIIVERSFFQFSETERREFLVSSMLLKFNILGNVVKNKKLDTNMTKLIHDFSYNLKTFV